MSNIHKPLDDLDQSLHASKLNENKQNVTSFDNPKSDISPLDYMSFDHLGYNSSGSVIVKSPELAEFESASRISGVLSLLSANSSGQLNLANYSKNQMEQLSEKDADLIKRISKQLSISKYQQDSSNFFYEADDGKWSKITSPDKKTNHHRDYTLEQVLRVCRQMDSGDIRIKKELEIPKTDEEVLNQWKHNTKPSSKTILSAPGVPLPTQEDVYSGNSIRKATGLFDKEYLLNIYNRCLDLFTLPRIEITRKFIDEEKLLKMLPDRENLKPYPEVVSREYHHVDNIELFCQLNSHYIVTISTEGDIRLTHYLYKYTLYTINLYKLVHQLESSVKVTCMTNLFQKFLIIGMSDGRIYIIDLISLSSRSNITAFFNVKFTSGGGRLVDDYIILIPPQQGCRNISNIVSRNGFIIAGCEKSSDKIESFLTVIKISSGIDDVQVQFPFKNESNISKHFKSNQILKMFFSKSQPILILSSKIRLFYLNLKTMEVIHSITLPNNDVIVDFVVDDDITGTENLCICSRHKIYWFDLELSVQFPYKTFVVDEVGLVGLKSFIISSVCLKGKLLVVTFANGQSYFFHISLTTDLTSNAEIIPILQIGDPRILINKDRKNGKPLTYFDESGNGVNLFIVRNNNSFYMLS